MSEQPQRQTSDNHALLAVALTVFIDLLGFGIVIPLLPIYSKAYGASELQLGLLFSSFSLMQLVFAPLWGRLSDRIGRRPVLIGGLLGTALSYVFFGFARGMPALFAARMLAGFFGANVSTAQAYIADVTTPKDRAKGMGLLGAAFGLGFTFGPLVGGELVRFHLAAPGLVAAALSLTAAVYGLARLPEPPREKRGAARVLSLGSVRYALRNGHVGMILALYFMGIFAFSGFETMFIRFGLARFPASFGVDGVIAHATMDEIFATAPIAGRYMFFIGLIAALVQGGLIRRLVPRYGETKLIVAGPFLLGLGLALIGLAPSWGLVIAGCALMPFGLGVNNPSLTSLLSRAAPTAQQGAFLGLNQSLGSLARVLGPIAGAASFQRFGPGSPFLQAAGVLGFATLLALIYQRRHGARLS
jgi:MFS family permease